ncbi:Unknown protein, partial [Striga hermonthica]
ESPRSTVFLRRNLGLCVALPSALYAGFLYVMDFDGDWKRVAAKHRIAKEETKKFIDDERKSREELERSIT